VPLRIEWTEELVAKRIVLWILAVAITLGSAWWQRTTGPTYPVRGSVSLAGRQIALRLERSHGGDTDMPVRVAIDDPAIEGEVAWRRFPTSDPWTKVPMTRGTKGLEVSLPNQPPAAKLEYQVRLALGAEHAVFPPRPAVTRFKGEVPPWILAPHILAMFVGMLLSTRSGLEALARTGDARRLTAHTLGFLVVGGVVLGPMVQKAAFGAYWTGVPFGWDLTDNKTLIAALAWGWAAWRQRGGRDARWDVVAASAVVLAVFAIPHSTWGSQMKW
jgi:hypothetical protein